MINLRAAFCAALFMFCNVGAAWADDVTLTSHDGAVEIGGTLLGFDGEFYRLDTIYGELTVDGTGVICAGPGCPNLTDYVAEVTISGSESMAEVLIPALIEAFALRNGYNVERESASKTTFEYHISNGTSNKLMGKFLFNASNADEGFADLLADEADIAMSLREVRPAEVAHGKEAGLGDLNAANRSRVLALDALVPVVAPGNPVTTISPDNLASVLAGKIDNWSALGGPDAPIDLFLLTEKSGLTQAIQDQLLTPVKLRITDTAQRFARNAELTDAITRAPFGLGIVSYADTGNTQKLTLTSGCGFSLDVTRRNVKTEDYPLTSPMFLYMPARRLPKLARDFLTYTRSPSAQVVIRRAGFVDQSPEEVGISLQGDRLANAIASAGKDVTLPQLQHMIGTLSSMKRLTTSFRFQAGSSQLDAQSRSNVRQLARALENGTYDGRNLAFVGFSDGDGPAAGNLTIGETRAEAVRRAVVAAAEAANMERVDVDVLSFGEALPMACDTSAWGRQVNRRVEVWVK